LPVAVGAVDGNRPEGRAEFDQGLDVDERLLRFEAVVLHVGGTFAVFRFQEAGVQVLKVPVQGNGSAVVVVMWIHGHLPRVLVGVIEMPQGKVDHRLVLRGAESLGVSPLRGAGPLRCASSHRLRRRLDPHGLPSLTQHNQARVTG